MPGPNEEDLKRDLDRLREREDALNGPGAFEHSLRQGRILIEKRLDEMTEAEIAFLHAPPPSRRH